jgi:outer membrane protein assembly factor BamB
MTAFGELGRSPRRRAVLVLAVAGLLGGCSDSLPSLPKLSDLNPFAEKQVPLPGTRVPILAEGNRIGGDLATADRPLNLPPPVANDAWTQPGGAPGNAPGHLALGTSLKTVWSVDIGTGSGKYGKLTAAPIVFDGRVYALDAAGIVTAYAASGGSVQWRSAIVPEGERNANKGYGGGLATDGARLYAVTGFGTALALDPRSGKKLWERQIGVPVRASPTVANDRLFFVTTEGDLYSLSTADGAENWQFKGMSERASLINNASPAVEGDIVLAPFTSGDIVAVRAATGQTVWTETLSRTRAASNIGALTDAARPAIEGGTAYAIGHGGRMVAVNARTGERLWNLTIPGIQQPWVAGDAVFVVDTGGQLLAITRRDGKVAWTTSLPGDGGTWSGPVLAGGRLWVVSSKGALVSADAMTGKLTGSQSLGSNVFIAPVVANGRMFILADNARLLALN